MTHPFERYLYKHGHYPRARLNNGSRQRISVTVAPSYIEIRTYPYGRSIYVPRKTLVALLKWLIPLVRLMEGNHDVEEAMHQQYLLDRSLDREFRREKRQRRGPRR